MTLGERTHVALGSYVCDHDGKASGRLVLDGDAVRHELVCECGQVIRLLGRQRYELDVGAARHRHSRGLWRRARLMFLFSRGSTGPPSLARSRLTSEPNAVEAIQALMT
jgi:hypothetical protein